MKRLETIKASATILLIFMLFLVSMFLFGCQPNNKDIYEFAAQNPASSQDTTHYIAKVKVRKYNIWQYDILRISKYPNMRFNGILYKVTVTKTGERNTLLLRKEI